jgi:hypothetical protein
MVKYSPTVLAAIGTPMPVDGAVLLESLTDNHDAAVAVTRN